MAITFGGVAGTKPYVTSPTVATSTTITLTSAIPSGSVAFACFLAYSSTHTSVADSVGNTWVKVSDVADSFSATVGSLWVCYNTIALSIGHTIVLTHTSSTHEGGTVAYYTGLISGSVDVSATAQAASGAKSVGPTSSTTQADEIVIAAFATFSGSTSTSWTVGSGFTDLGNSGTGSSGSWYTIMLEGKIVSSIGTQTATITEGSGSGEWGGLVITFKGIGASGGHNALPLLGVG